MTSESDFLEVLSKATPAQVAQIGDALRQELASLSLPAPETGPTIAGVKPLEADAT